MASAPAVPGPEVSVRVIGAGRQGEEVASVPTGDSVALGTLKSAASPVRSVVASPRRVKGKARRRLQLPPVSQAEGAEEEEEEEGKEGEALPSVPEEGLERARPLPPVCVYPMRGMWRAERVALYCDEVLRGCEVRAGGRQRTCHSSGSDDDTKGMKEKTRRFKKLNSLNMYRTSSSPGVPRPCPEGVSVRFFRQSGSVSVKGAAPVVCLRASERGAERPKQCPGSHPSFFSLNNLCPNMQESNYLALTFTLQYSKCL